MRMNEPVRNRDVAIIGMAVKFPKSDDTGTYWENIKNSVDCIGSFPESRRADTDNYIRYMDSEPEFTEYLKGSYLENIDMFDYELFGLSPKEASLMDPNQRLFLEIAYSAIEDAGYATSEFLGTRTGVYIGFPGQFTRMGYSDVITEIDPSAIPVSFAGNIPSIIAGRVSYFLNLRGPALLFDTACSSSLVALHYAYRDLRNGDCDMAIAGGVRIRLLPIGKSGVEGIESPDSKTRTFDDMGNGVGAGEGVAAVVLKSYKKAIEDGDNIYAVMKGSAINQDGRSVGITAPNVAAQEDVIVRAWEDAEIDPETISYIEAHGTATKLGDPTEILGIRKAFRRYTQKNQFCAVGSVKTNMGHLLGAAGIAGVIKAALALKNKQIPPSINFNRPNKIIKFEDSPVYVNDELLDWDMDGSIRRCGVSSFGISGTNCHIVLEEPLSEQGAEVGNTGNKELPFILTLSAKNIKVLKALVSKHIKYLNEKKFPIPYNLCYTANTGRNHFNCRLAITFYGMDDLSEKLTNIYNDDIENLTIEGVFYNRHKAVAALKGDETAGTVTAAQKNEMTKTAREKLEELLSERGSKSDTAEEICRLYVRGADVDWSLLYNKNYGRRISLPTYPFDRKRCWIEIPDVEDTLLNEDKLFYGTEWCEAELKGMKKGTKTGEVLVLKGQTQLSDALVQALLKQGVKVIEIETGDRFKKNNDYSYICGESRNDFDSLIDEIKAKNICHIVHMRSLSGTDASESLDAFQGALNKGLYSLFHLVGAIAGNKMKNNLDIVLISENVHEVTKKERTIRPENASLFGLGKCVNWERYDVKCRCIDIDEEVTANELVSELMEGKNDFIAAYRGKTRFVEQIVRQSISSLETRDIGFKDSGIYVIVGGTGGIGLEICKSITADNRLNVALIGRSGFPKRKDWERLLSEEKDKGIIKRIKAIKEVETNGSKVELLSTDISDMFQVQQLFKLLREKYCRINGIIHSAAVDNGELLTEISEENFKAAVAAKLQGTWVLDKVTREDDLDFFALFSSTMTLVSGKGSGAYTAANCYLDSFSYYREKIGKPGQTINWPKWIDTGMSKGKVKNEDKEIFKFIPAKSAVAAFNKVLDRRVKRTVIGQMNFKGTVFELGEYLPFKLSEELKHELEKGRNVELKSRGSSKKVDVILKGKNDFTATEKLLAQVWGRVLGYKDLNIGDNFFEMGGDSILAVKMEVELERCGIDLTAQDILKYPTIELMAEYMRKNEETKGSKVVLDNIEPFNDLFYKSCFYNSFFPVINRYEKSIIPFMANDIIVYSFDDKAEGRRFGVDFIQIESIGGLLKKSGMEVETKRESADIIKDVTDSIEKGRPVIIWVDCYYESIRKDTFKKIHCPHTWLIYGSDKENSTFDIVEHAHRQHLTYDKRTISFEDTVNCYWGYLRNFPYDSEITYYEFYPSESSEDSIIDYDYCSRILAGSVKKHEGAVRKGIEQVLVIINYLEQVMSDESELKLGAEELLGYINNIINAKKIEKYRMGELFKNQAQLYELLSSIISCWDSSRLAIAKYMYSGVYSKSVLNKAIEKLSRIYDLEVEYLEVVSELSK